MALKQLFVAVALAAALLVHYSDAAAPRPRGSGSTLSNPYKSHCGGREMSHLFNRCLMTFGINQLAAFANMSSANTCQVDKLSCGLAGEAARCLGKLIWPRPPRRSSFGSRCKAGIKETLSYLMMEYRFNCGYHDVECKCWKTIPDISPAAARGEPRTVEPQGCPATTG